MKPFWLLLGLLAPICAFGQSTGTVVFANTAQTLFTTNDLLLGQQGSGNMSGSNQYRVGLYVAPDGTTLESAFTLVAVGTNSSIAAGRFTFSGNPVNPPGNTGQPIAYLVKAWSLAFGNSYEQASAFSCGAFAPMTRYLGRSPIGRVIPATGSNPAPTLFGTGEFAGQLTRGIQLEAYFEDCSCPTRITDIRAVGTNVTLRLEGPAIRYSYCMSDSFRLHAASFVTGPWTNLNVYFPLTVSGFVELTDTNPPTPRFYRVRVE